MDPSHGFLFPNELHITWTVMIVLYPYITGMVAGAFIVSSFYHVFGMEKLKPIARFALVSSFAFLLFATVPLLNHLGRPERAINILLTPNFNSAMSGFGFIYMFYMIIVFLEIWFSYRVDLIERYEKSRGIVKVINQESIDLMSKWLWGFMIIAVTLELMEILSISYERTEKWAILSKLINHKLKISYVYLQIGLFSIVPFLMLTVTSLFQSLNNNLRNSLIWLSSGLLLLQVLFMRWNVVIGGQLVSKSMRGFTDYFPGYFDKEGLLVSFLIIITPFILLRLFDKIFPFFGKKELVE